MIKKRNVALCIIFSLLTCGIYGMYWFVCLTNETNTAASVNETSGGMALLFTLLTCGIYGFYWAYKLGDKLDTAARNHGVPEKNRGVLYLILNIFGLGIITNCLAQSELNNYANAE